MPKLKDPLIGKQIEGYVVQEIIGHEPYSVVFRAKHKRWRRTRAVKTLRSKDLALGAEFLDAINKEIDLLGHLPDHRLTHIVRPYNADIIKDTETVYDGIPYILMEYMDRGNLQDSYEKMSLEERVWCVIDAVRGLEDAHSVGVLHLDFHPGNILLNRKGEVKVSDFGVGAKIDTKGYYYSGSRRPVRFRAPEQWTSAPELDIRISEKTDVYQVGATLLYITTGMMPVIGIEEQLQIGHHDVPYKLKKLAVECCEFRPKNRPELRDVRQRLERLKVV